MSTEVKRYDAVHIRYEDNNIRYGEGCEVEVVTASDYAALEAECERLRSQVSALQSDANSWQSGYDKGREDGAKAADGWKAQHARDSAELRRLCAERDQQWRIRRDVEADRDTANAVSSELRAQRDALAAENEALVRNLRGKHSLVGATYGHLIRQRDEALAKLAELAEVKGREAVAFYWQDIGYPEPRTHGPYFGQPSESALRNVEGGAIPVPLYTLPPASPDVEGLVKALQRLLSWSDRQVCTHEETHRDGAIWEICDMCGAKWADDEGGKPEFKWPDEIEGARTALSTWRQAQEGKP